MNIFLKIPEEELGRFLLAYNRGLFGRAKFGASFLHYYGIVGFDNIRNEINDNKSMEMIKQEFLGRLG